MAGGEQSELERLRAEVATLRSQLRGAGGDAERRQRWRTIVAALLLVLACVLAPLGVVAVWARNQVTNTDRYVATVAPLASDPAIQQAITDRITAPSCGSCAPGCAPSSCWGWWWPPGRS
jgi:type VI protein secretion system component VasK